MVDQMTFRGLQTGIVSIPEGFEVVVTTIDEGDPQGLFVA
jgi:hypothetical protein